MPEILPVLRSRLFLLLAFISIFSSVSAQWVRKADALKPRSELGETVVYNSKLYNFVGFSDSLRHAEPTSEVYDPATNTWSYIASLPPNTAMTHQDVILIDNMIWLIGGRVGQNPGPLSSVIWIYNINTNSWSKGPEIRDPATGQPMVIAASGSALLGRVLHIFGGFTPTACNNDQDKYHLTLDVDTWLSNPSLPAKWENKLKPLPLKRNHLSAVVLGGKIYAIGGQLGHDCGGGKEVSYCHVYNPSTDTWTQLTSLPTGRSHSEGATFAIDGKIYMVGGQGSDGYATKKVTSFDPAGNNDAGTWTENTSLALPYIYEGLSARIIGSTFIIAHGSRNSSKYGEKVTYSRTIVRHPVYKLGFPSECLNLNDSSGNIVKGYTWLYTIDSTKSYTTSSSANWLTVTKNATGTANQNAVDIEVTANTTRLAPGVYNATITATGTGGGTNYTAASLCVKLTVQQKNSPSQYNLIVTSVGIGNVSKTPDQATYQSGSNVVLSATPGDGQQFTGWSGDTSGTTNPLTINMNANKQVTARFEPIPVKYNLSLSANGSGTVVKSPDQTSYDSGTSVTLTATADAGQQFAGWNGDITGLTSPVTITMDADKNVTATFAQHTGEYSLSTNTTGDGTVTRNADQTTYAYGSGVTLTATPATGQQFIGWSGSASGTDNPLTITMDADKTITATFAQIPAQYSLTVSASGNGTVTKDPGQTTYAPASGVTLTATPAAGQQFTGWSGGASGIVNPLTITMDADKTVTATFAPAVITNIATTTGRKPALGQLFVGTTIYTDRVYEATSVPVFLNYAPLIKTANDDKLNKSTNALSFTLLQNATVYVAYDPRSTALPAWLSSWQKVAGQQIGVNDSKITYMLLYSKDYAAGKVTLGGNLTSPAAGAQNNYFVVAVAKQVQRPINNAVTTVGSSNEINNSNKDLFQMQANIVAGFKVYPNPNHGDKISIEVNNFLKQETVTITLQNALGQIVESRKIIADNNGAFKGDILMNKPEKGFYIIKAISSSRNLQQKLMID